MLSNDQANMQSWYICLGTELRQKYFKLKLEKMHIPFKKTRHKVDYSVIGDPI